MKKFKTVIIDDESRARETIKNMLLLYCNDLELVGEAVDVASGVKLIQSKQPDLVLLDIKMPDGSGFDLLERLDEFDFALIFITAFNDYAIKAFKFNALDYILKPIDPDELLSAIKRAKKSIKNRKDDFSVVLKNLKALKKDQKRLVLKTIENIYVVPLHEIIQCQSSGNYTTFYFIDQKPILISSTLKTYEEILNEFGFVRVHQSYLVNIEHVKRYDKSDSMLIMSNDKSVPVATRKKEELLKVLDII